MTDLSPAQELLADLGRRIAQEQTKTAEKIERIKNYIHPDSLDERIREEWHQCNLAALGSKLTNQQIQWLTAT